AFVHGLAPDLAKLVHRLALVEGRKVAQQCLAFVRVEKLIDRDMPEGLRRLEAMLDVERGIEDLGADHGPIIPCFSRQSFEGPLLLKSMFWQALTRILRP